MFHQSFNSNTQPNFYLFKMNGNLTEQTTNRSLWCVPVGTVNLVASGTAGISPFRGDYWAQSSNPNGLNYLTWNPGLLPRTYGTQESVVVASGAVTVKQMGVSVYTGVRLWEPAKTLLDSLQGYMINGSDQTGSGGLPLGHPNRLYFVSCYSPAKAVQKVYSMDASNNLTLLDTLTKTAAGTTIPAFGGVTSASQVFSFTSFNGLDNHAGLLQYVKFSNTYSETPTFARQDI